MGIQAVSHLVACKTEWHAFHCGWRQCQYPVKADLPSSGAMITNDKLTRQIYQEMVDVVFGAASE